MQVHEVWLAARAELAVGLGGAAPSDPHKQWNPPSAPLPPPPLFFMRKNVEEGEEEETQPPLIYFLDPPLVGRTWSVVRCKRHPSRLYGIFELF